MTSLICNLAGVALRNPIIMASGTFGFGREYGELYDLSILGGIASKGLTLHPRSGNTGCRVQETPSGMMNSVGLENPGVACFLENELYKKVSSKTPVISKLGGAKMEE